MDTKRESNYDLLRIISTFAVIVIHVSATYISGFTNDKIFGYINFNGAFVTCLYNTLPRFAVPCFLMLSGAFLLNDERNADYEYFYKKSFKNIGIPTLVFTALYFLYSFLKCAAKIYIRGNELSALAEPFLNLLKGKPFYHMWYLYMLIGVYMLIPVIIRVKNDIGEKAFEKLSYIFFAAAIISIFTSNYTLQWNIGISFCFSGYAMIGYTIKKKASVNNLLGICKIFGGGGTLAILAFVRYKQACSGIDLTEDLVFPHTLASVSPGTPFIAAISILIFSGFANLDIKRNFGKLPSLTFLIYLIHAAIWNVMEFFL